MLPNGKALSWGQIQPVPQKITANVFYMLVRVKKWGKSSQAKMVTFWWGKPYRMKDHVNLCLS